MRDDSLVPFARSNFCPTMTRRQRRAVIASVREAIQGTWDSFVAITRRAPEGH